MARHAEPAPWSTFLWDGLHSGDWAKTFEGADAVINLAGRSVNCRYNEANRREIKSLGSPPRALLVMPSPDRHSHQRSG